MKYKNRDVENFSLYVELGEEFNDENWKRNQSHVVNVLRKNKISGWLSAEAVMDDLVVLDSKENSIKAINLLYSKVNGLFKKVSISVMYKNFDEYEYNAESFDDYLDMNLYSE